MTINDNILCNSEKTVLSLRTLYSGYGYSYFRMNKFEEYDLYAKNKDFLVSDNVITFTDTSGKLMALKPDVTLSVIKNSADDPDVTRKIYYCENVYRTSKSTDSFCEIMQVGVECIGNPGEADIFEVITLALESLKTVSQDYVLDISNLSILGKIISMLGVPGDQLGNVYEAIGKKNLNELDALCSDCGADIKVLGILKKLLSGAGPLNEVKKTLPGIFDGLQITEESAEFLSALDRLSQSEYAGKIRVDFSVIDDINYYNDIVFKGFIGGIPFSVLSGGQYDRLMRKLGRKSKAVGFAVYTDLLDRIEDSDSQHGDGFVNIALPKGRLGEKVYDMFARAGFDCPSILEQNRKLVFENPEKQLRFFWVKPSDVAIYVERGAADIGVAGKDILLEYEPDVYELADLKKGICKMAVAAPKGYTDDPSRSLRVATKFSKIAKKHYASTGRDIDIIHLNGSIEIAPILGLSDVIVDIVETGSTLRENNLEVIEDVVPISARLISNKTSFKFKNKTITRIADALSKAASEEVSGGKKE